ncbi:MAG TPA: outer membrane beta-barrel protein [Cyclobacteriaceae bacterium]
MKFRYLILLLLISPLCLAQNIESFGVFGGFNIPFTIDQGLKKDLRFYGKFTLRGSPFGFNYGYDKVGYGFLITPQFLQIGQKYTIHNTAGGEVGIRDIKMNFISVPVALKIHINDMAFFRLSLVAAINFQYLFKGEETLTHTAAKLNYPPSVHVPTDPGYLKVYDGVFVPEVKDQVHVSQDKFKPFQLFAGVGLRSDFDLNDDWSLNFDGRANFGIFDPRKSDYIEQLKQPTDAPDLYGQRRDVYLTGAIGIARIIQIKEKFRHHGGGKMVGNKYFPKERGRKKPKN